MDAAKLVLLFLWLVACVCQGMQRVDHKTVEAQAMLEIHYQEQRYSLNKLKWRGRDLPNYIQEKVEEELSKLSLQQAMTSAKFTIPLFMMVCAVTSSMD